MTTMMRLLAFRALAPNTDGGAGDPPTHEPEQVTEQDPTTITAEDVLAELEADNGDEKPAEEPSEEDDEEGDSDEEEPEEEEEEDEDDESEESDRFSLDPKVLEALEATNPKEAKRLQQQISGLRKAEAQIEGSKQTLELANSYFNAFQNKEHAGPAIKGLAEQVAKLHGMSLQDLIGADIGTDTSVEDWEAQGYESRKEYELAKRIEKLEAENAAKQRQAEKLEYLNSVAPKTIRKIENLDQGWKVTKAMVQEAMDNMPNVKDPAKAVQMWFSDDRAKHFAQLSRVKAKRGPEAHPSAMRNQDRRLPSDPMKITADHILRDL